MSRKHRGASAYSMGSDALDVNSYFFWIKFALDQVPKASLSHNSSSPNPKTLFHILLGQI